MTRLIDAPGWVDADPDRPLPFWSTLRDDLNAYRASLSCGNARVILAESGFYAGLLYRLSHRLHHCLRPLGPLFSLAFTWLLRHHYGCMLAPTARLHGGLFLPYPLGIVIGPGATIGPGSHLYQNVTLGGAPDQIGLPHVGSDARIYASAVLIGPITLGDRVLIGALAVVDRDVPSDTAVRCPPADLIRCRSDEGMGLR
jgi:serine O-acetyltransferase